MAAKVSSEKVLSDSGKILTVWEAHPDFKLGTVTLADFKTQHEGLAATREAIDAKNRELVALINTREGQALELNGLNSRARSGFRATFGPDSTEYEQAGGVRSSERKKPVRKKKTAA